MSEPQIARPGSTLPSPGDSWDWPHKRDKAFTDDDMTIFQLTRSQKLNY